MAVIWGRAATLWFSAPPVNLSFHSSREFFWRAGLASLRVGPVFRASGRGPLLYLIYFPYLPHFLSFLISETLPTQSAPESC